MIPGFKELKTLENGTEPINRQYNKAYRSYAKIQKVHLRIKLEDNNSTLVGVCNGELKSWKVEKLDRIVNGLAKCWNPRRITPIKHSMRLWLVKCGMKGKSYTSWLKSKAGTRLSTVLM